MARRRKERPAKKFGTPLYCAVWPKGKYAFVGGGGGKSSSGIPNKIVTVHCENGQVSDAAAGTIMLQDAPMRMALPSHENTLAVALGDGGILKFSISRDADGIPVLQQTQGRPAEEFARIGIVECMAFSSDGRVLGVSTADGLLTIYDWHTGRPLNVLRAEHGVSSTIRDLCFSPAHQNKVLAAVADNGTCSLWAWEKRMQIEFLELPKELKGGTFSKVRWSQDGRAILYAVVNINAKGEGHIVQYEQVEDGTVVLLRQALLQKKNISAFSVSDSGALLGIGTVEGDAAVFDSATLKPLGKSPDAHMVFSTAVAFSKTDGCLLSASADASVWITPAKSGRGRSGSGVTILLLLLFLLLCCAVGAWLMGVDRRILDALHIFDVQPGSHSEL